jgi:ABC-type amino acid transport substrate-binding protein
VRFVGQQRRKPGQGIGVLRVGTEGVYSPFSYHDPATGQLVGYDVDVARAVADKLGVKVEFVETPWDAIFAALEANRFDVVANEVTINAERKQKYDLSEPYSVGEGVIVTRADDNSVKSLDDIQGKVAGETATSNWARRSPATTVRGSRPWKASPRPSSCSTRAGWTW